MTNGDDRVDALTFTQKGSEPKLHGLTKREYFAAMALQGMGTWSPVQDRSIPLIYGDALAARAEWAVRQADALIAALNEVKP